ncbi:unnamed protein product [Schistocephalus solidus]|uniref:DUF3504 domain-containing protein n=1 Tax=Schistocephalus solidus TaxID=70667 RepID=A0A183S7S3_SCHSO|nr:unnamed protein product [Schistocephalus solidus]
MVRATSTDRSELMHFFFTIKAVYGPPVKVAAHLSNAQVTTLLNEKTRILKCKAKHFRSVRNRPSTISDATIDQTSQVETKADLNLLPFLQETIWAVQQLSSGKAPRSNAWRHPTAFFQAIWRQKQVYQDFKDIHLYKKKGNCQLSDNHRGTLLVNTTGKIFACILLNHINGHQERGPLPVNHCGFRPPSRHHRDDLRRAPAAGVKRCRLDSTLPSWI